MHTDVDCLPSNVMINLALQTERATSQSQVADDPNLSYATVEAALAQFRGETSSSQRGLHTVPARRVISRERDLYDSVPFICEGWAALTVVLSDSSRQILSFRLPGDIASTVLLFESRKNYVIEAITETHYRMFKRSELRELLLASPDFHNKVSMALIEEKAQSDRLIVDLGRCSAEERIARLILRLFERLKSRGMVQLTVDGAAEMEFPLRQHHIADATGLTSVHVSKVLTDFRRRSLIVIRDRMLTIADRDGLRRLAELR
jgi:CRP/FNR family transcriptional regulator, anaerobic regulatory protein